MMSTTVLWLCLIQTLIWATVHSAPPTCTPGSPTVEVNSDQVEDSLLLELDNICDDSDNDPLTYTISTGNNDGLFKIDGNQVLLAKEIPGLMQYRYVMKIGVDDGTSQTLYLPITVTIRFNNNLNDPAITLPSSIINIPESTQIGTFITACTVSDADASKGSLSGVTRVGILNPYGALGRKFVLDSVSCELFVNTVLDYENIKAYNLVIEAWDLDPNSPRKVNQTITINVQDDNDNRPTCTAYEILEATTLAATVGQQIFKPNCSDVDSGTNGQITYSMDASNTAPATNLFEVESITGILKVKSAITDTNIPFYEVVINVKDGGYPSQESKVLVRVVVTDASGTEPNTFDRHILYPATPPAVVPLSTTGRTPPARSDPPSIPRCVRNAVNLVMPEDQLANTELYDLACSDPDGVDEDLQYVITKGDVYSSFVVIGGKFRLKKAINGDFTSKRSIHINVTDPTGLSTSVVVAVYITNGNDNDPVIKNLPGSIQVREDQPIGTIVNSCSVNEKDSKQSLPPGGQTRVGWINSDPDTQYWFLDSITCDLYVNTALDYETTKSYTLLVGAWDLDPTAPRTVTGTMTVSILDANDNPPICPATYDASVPEDAAIGTVLETVVCTDADSGDNANVFFKVDDANEAVVKSSFTVGISGQVTVQAALDFETRTSYDVVVIAYDGGLPSLSSTSTIRVTVTDVADGGATVQNTSTPDYTFKPTVGITLVGNAPVGFEFLCNFNLDTKPLWYLVNWYVNGNKIYTTPRVSSAADVLDGTKLTEAKMVQIGVTTVGFDISCEFRASFADDSNLGAKSTSDPKFVGIKVLTTDVTIAQGAEGVIKVQATAPIGCNGATCDFPLYTFLQTNGYDCAVSQAEVPCGVNIDTGSYANVYDIRIKGGITFQYGRSGSTSILKLRSAETYADHPMWANYELDDVTVTVTQDTTIIEGSKCAAFVDPRVVTFDKGLLDLQEVGVYTLYSHPATKSEIQIESYKCDEATGAHCVCGVALRTGRSVFKLDGCGQTFNDIQFSLCDDNHLKVEKLERFYQVYFPTGTRVTIFIRPKNMNVFIYPSVMDINNSGGLCGKLSGNLQDDLVKRDGSTSNEPLIRGLFQDAPDFFESWKVGINLFDIEAGVYDGGLTTLDGSTFVYDPADYSCSPIGNSLLGRTGSVTNEACSIFTDVGRIQSDADSVGFTTVARPAECKTNKKRRRRRSVRAQKKPLNLQEEAHFRAKRSVWKNGWTSESATTFCNDLFNQSSMVTLCKDLALVDITSSQIACYQDIELTGSANYSLDTMSAIRSQCIHEVSADDSFKVPDVPGQKPLIESILEVTCPGECTQQGQCVDGKCQCNEGFGAIDCSVDITEQPLLVTLENEGYCDARDQDCSQISAFGETFVAGQNMRCKTTYFELIEDVQGMVMKDESEHVPFIESISEAVCTFPPLPVRTAPDNSVVAYGYRISLTNDGEAYSDANYMVIFNSECQTCNIFSTGVNCSVQSGYCVSDGQCYKNGSAHKEKVCYTCQFSKSEGTIWAISGDEVCIGVEKDDDDIGVEKDDDDMLWIIGVVLGVLCVIILAGIVFFLVNRKKNKISLSQTQLNPGPSRKFSKTYT